MDNEWCNEDEFINMVLELKHLVPGLKDFRENLWPDRFADYKSPEEIVERHNRTEAEMMVLADQILYEGAHG